MTPAAGAFRLTRGALFALGAVGLASGAHLAGGEPVSLPVALLAVGAVMLVANPLAATPKAWRARSRPARRRPRRPRPAPVRDRGVSIPRHRSAARLLAVAAVLLGTLGGAVVGAAGPAAAHATLERTDPADGARTPTLPGWITLTFDQPVLALGSVVEIEGPGGDVAQGPVTVVDTDVRQGVRLGSPAGAYTVRWRVTSTDGHPISGSFRFTAVARTTNAVLDTAAPGAAPDGDDAGTDPAVVWLLVASASLVVAAGIYLATRRRRPAGTDDEVSGSGGEASGPGGGEAGSGSEASGPGGGDSGSGGEPGAGGPGDVRDAASRGQEGSR